MALYQLNCYSEKQYIGLENYADLIITDSEKKIIGLRFGGYPEAVMAMTDAIMGGCFIRIKLGKEKVELTSHNLGSFFRKTSHDGIYAESIMFLKC